MADAKYDVEALTVEGLFETDSVSFKVPIFQRGYAWGAEKVTQLLDDLYWLGDTSNAETAYFLGSIVLAGCRRSQFIPYIWGVLASSPTNC